MQIERVVSSELLRDFILLEKSQHSQGGLSLLSTEVSPNSATCTIWKCVLPSVSPQMGMGDNMQRGSSQSRTGVVRWAGKDPTHC